MNMVESLINFQNKAEEDFKNKKSAGNIFSYIIALVVFFASTLVAGLTWPIRGLLKLFNGKEKVEIHKADAKNIDGILRTNELVLLNFTAEWCGPCLLMKGILKEFTAEHNDVYVAKINSDTNNNILKKYGIRGVPQFLLLHKGAEVKRHAGPMSLSELNTFCLT